MDNVTSTNNNTTDINPTSDTPKARKGRRRITEDMFEQIKRWNDKGKSVIEMAELSDVCVSTVYNTVRKIEEHHDTISYPELYKKSGIPHKDYSSTFDLIRRIIGDDASLTQKGIQCQLKEEGVDLSVSSICLILKKAGISRKRLKKRPKVVVSPEHEEVVQNYCKQLRQLSTDRQILFLDETLFKLHVSTVYGYADVNSTPSVACVPSNSGQSLSVCALISNVGVESYEVIDGGYDIDTFMHFVHNAHNAGVFNQHPVLIMNNSPLHESSILKEFLQQCDVEVTFLPTHSNKLNAIENWFNSLRAKVNTIRPHATDTTNLKNNIHNSINSYSQQTHIFQDVYTKMHNIIDGINK